MSYAQEKEQIAPDAFAKFLFESKLHDFAAEEYERLLFDDPGNLNYLKKLIESYKLSGQTDIVQTRLQILDHDDTDLVMSYYDLLLMSDNANKIEEYFEQQKMLFTEEQQEEIRFKSAVGGRKWKEASRMYNTYPSLERFSAINGAIKNAGFKKPVLAAVMSTLVPGTGRIYAKDTKDGIISMIFVASAGYQAYRRFNEGGSKSVSGWIYGGISLGFYLSNIYGSYQSAKYYNHKIDEKLHSFSVPLLVDSSK